MGSQSLTVRYGLCGLELTELGTRQSRVLLVDLLIVWVTLTDVGEQQSQSHSADRD